MSLINCNDCRTEVSQFANACPKCGFPVKFEYEKSELKRKIDKERNSLIGSKKLLEGKLATIILPKKRKSFLGVSTIILLLIAITIMLFNLYNNQDSWMVILIIGNFLIPCFGFLCFLDYIITKPSKKSEQVFEQFRNLEKKIHVTQEKIEELSSNKQYINSPSVSPKVIATLAASGYGLYQMTSMRKQLEQINETLTDSGGDASGGESGGDSSGGDGGGGGDFGGF